MRRMASLLVLVYMFAFTNQAIARGDKIVPQVADGSNIRTKFDLVNISSIEPIENFTVRFFRQDGSPWSVATNLGRASEFVLKLGARQSVRLETSGLSNPTTSGYVVIEDEENRNSTDPRDFVLGISVFYEVYTATGVVDTVSVPVSEPTAIVTFPVEISEARAIYTGLAVVNLTTINKVTVELFASDGSAAGSAAFTLGAGEQRAEFLNQKLFPSLKNLKGMAELTGIGPVAILTLLQTRTSNGVQYSTLVPVDKEALRRNSYVLVPHGTFDTSPIMPLDVDLLTVDYFRKSEGEEGYPWDMIYEGVDQKTRHLKPSNGAAFAVLGNMEPDQFDQVSLPELKRMTYREENIDLSDVSPNLKHGFAVAIRTDLGNFAKVRMVRIIEILDDQGRLYKDLAFEVYVYK